MRSDARFSDKTGHSRKNRALGRHNPRWNAVRENWQLYLLALVPVAYIIVFHYVPLYCAQIAFRRYVPARGFLGSEWVGFHHFIRFVRSFNFSEILWNTISINIYGLIAGFPIPIILAILLHYCPNTRYRKIVQMVTYAPNFISTVVMVGIIFKMFTTRVGIVNVALVNLGLEEVNWLGNAEMFPHIYIWTGIWQGMGWGSIIYLAALSAVDPELHESAKVDGAVIWHIDIPSILPTVVILLILRSGQMLSVGFEKIFLMQNPLNIRTSEVIQTYVYKVGLASSSPNFSYAAAIGLFTSVVSFILLLIVNKLANRLGETSLW